MLQERLQKARMAAGYQTIYAVWKSPQAKKMKLSLSTLSDLENGMISNPRMQTLVNLADLYHVSLDALLEREEYLCPS